MDIEFLKEQYKFEIERKDTLTNSMAIPVGVLTVLGGLLGFLSRDFSYDPTKISLAFVVVLAISALLFLVSIVLLFSAYHGYAYSYLPTARPGLIYRIVPIARKNGSGWRLPSTMAYPHDYWIGLRMRQPLYSLR